MKLVVITLEKSNGDCETSRGSNGWNKTWSWPSYETGNLFHQIFWRFLFIFSSLLLKLVGDGRRKHSKTLLNSTETHTRLDKNSNSLLVTSLILFGQTGLFSGSVFKAKNTDEKILVFYVSLNGRQGFWTKLFYIIIWIKLRLGVFQLRRAASKIYKLWFLSEKGFFFFFVSGD